MKFIGIEVDRNGKPEPAIIKGDNLTEVKERVMDALHNYSKRGVNVTKIYEIDLENYRFRAMEVKFDGVLKLTYVEDNYMEGELC